MFRLLTEILLREGDKRWCKFIGHDYSSDVEYMNKLIDQSQLNSIMTPNGIAPGYSAAYVDYITENPGQFLQMYCKHCGWVFSEDKFIDVEARHRMLRNLFDE